MDSNNDRQMTVAISSNDPITIEYDHMLFSCRFLYLANMDFWFSVYAWSNPIQICTKKIKKQVYLISFKTLFTLHTNRQEQKIVVELL